MKSQIRRRRHSALTVIDGNAKARNITLADVWNDYRKLRKLTERSLTVYGYLLNGVFADWLDRKVDGITDTDVIRRFREISLRSPSTANLAMRLLKALFHFAMNFYDELSIARNPVAKLCALRLWNKEKIRQTYIKSCELKGWWQKVQGLENTCLRDMLTLVLLTGLRRNEARMMRWTDVNFADRSSIIPVTKNHDPHVMPMSEFVYALLLRRKNEARAGVEFVFPSSKHPFRPIQSCMSLPRQKGLENATFTLHDLRRSFLTACVSAGLSHYQVKMLANHRISTTDITARYCVKNADDLREPVERVTRHILERAGV